MRILLFGIFTFIVGFMIHALFFPYLFTQNLSLFADTEVKPTITIRSDNNLITRVTYQNGQFNPRIVRIKKSYYLSIVNESPKELMHLVSDNADLTTPRGYGTSETTQVQLFEPGTYTVTSTGHPDSKLQVMVVE